MTKPPQRGVRSPTRAQRSFAERARVWQGLARAQRSFAERARAAATRRLRRGQQSNASAGQDGANRYAYVYNRPTTLVNPSGFFSFSFSGIANFFDSLLGGGDDDYSGLFSTPPLGAFEISGGRICFPSCNSETESSITNNPPPTSSPSEPPSSSGPMAPADPQTPSSADTTPSAPSANQSATAAGGDGPNDGTNPSSQQQTAPPTSAASTIPFLPSAPTWQEIVQAGWNAVKVLAAAAGSDVALAVGAAIAMTKDASDASHQQMYYHYTTSPITSFAGGLFAGSYATDVGTYTSEQAHDLLGINRPTMVIPILAYPGDFIPDEEFRVPAKEGEWTGGGNQYRNPVLIPPSQLLPPRFLR